MTTQATIIRAAPCRAERSFAAALCQFFSAKNIPKISKDRHVHGSSPPVSAAVFFRSCRDLTPVDDAYLPYTTDICLKR